MTDWCLYQSRVDFSPEEDRTPVRKRLLRTAVREILPMYVFDGTVLYACRRLHPDPLELFVDPEGNLILYNYTHLMVMAEMILSQVKAKRCELR